MSSGYEPPTARTDRYHKNSKADARGLDSEVIDQVNCPVLCLYF